MLQESASPRLNLKDDEIVLVDDFFRNVSPKLGADPGCFFMQHEFQVRTVHLGDSPRNLFPGFRKDLNQIPLGKMPMDCDDTYREKA